MVKQVFDVQILMAILLLIHIARSPSDRFRHLKDWFWISEDEEREEEF